jgi:fido (protein-threonine AMPylation protein)
MMGLSPEDIERRRDAVRRSRVDSQISGQCAHPDDAKLLDAWARGEIDGDEVRRRALARISAQVKQPKNGGVRERATAKPATACEPLAAEDIRMPPPERIADDERAFRIEQTNYARGSVWLEGFILGEQVEGLISQYIEGALSRAELPAAIRRRYDPIEVWFHDAGRSARAQREGELVASRLLELYAAPLAGAFNAPHLQALHAYLFQDFSGHAPGLVRKDTDLWRTFRAVEDQDHIYEVRYVSRDVEARLTAVLAAFGGAQSLRGHSLERAAEQLATLYGDLDHVHGFYEGNARTLREFTRTLALAAGFHLQWVPPKLSPHSREALHIAQDLEVIARALPGLTAATATNADDHLVLSHAEHFRAQVGERALERLVRDRLTTGTTSGAEPPPLSVLRLAR